MFIPSDGHCALKTTKTAAIAQRRDGTDGQIRPLLRDVLCSRGGIFQLLRAMRDTEKRVISRRQQDIVAPAADLLRAAGPTQAEFLRAALAGILLSTGTPAAGQVWGASAFSAGPMLTRPIHSTGETMPVIGLGTWQVFDVAADPAARRPLQKVLRLLLDSGGRMIYGSPMYRPAEAVIGDLVTEMAARPRFFPRDQGMDHRQRARDRADTALDPVVAHAGHRFDTNT